MSQDPIPSYTTVDDVKREAGMSDNENIADEDVQDFITTAESIINGRLVGKYTIPFSFTDTPGIIERICRGLAAAYLLMQEYGPMSPGDSKDGEAKETLMMKLLKELQRGETVVVDNEGVSMLTPENKATSYQPKGSSSSAGAVVSENIGNFEVASSDTPSSGPHIKMGQKF